MNPILIATIVVSAIGLIAGLGLYAVVGVAVLTVILGLIAIFSGKKAPALVRAISFFLTWAFPCRMASEETN